MTPDIATHTYVVDIHHAVQKFLEAVDEKSRKRGLVTLNDLRDKGLLPRTSEELEKIIDRSQRNLNRSVEPSLLKLPHPIRVFDYMNLPLVLAHITQSFLVSFLSMASDPSYSAEDIEDVITHIHQYRREPFPEFCEYMDTSGSGMLMNQYIPLMQILRKAPIFDLEESACLEIENLDIASGIDSTYLRAPAPTCFFSLGKTNEKLHDSISGWHELEGFYITETEVTTRTLTNHTAHRMGIDITKPMRCMSFIFVGKPFDTIANDSLCKIDVYLQDGISIDQIIQSTTEWYCGQLESTEQVFNIAEDGSERTMTQYIAENKLSNLSEMNIEHIEHNIRLLKTAINVLAYLNFAPFRKKEKTDRSDAEKVVAAKSSSNKAKAYKKVLGTVDRITISSNVEELSSGMGKGVGHTKSKHFRRGHLRNQRYGSGDDIHYKPIYIAPMIIAGGDSDNDIAAKPYRVK
ncbi:hypothetical protein KW429_11370 [Vibrio fluvialis]|nr:hypothetical protein [Vibrio fluvialis]MBY7902306.1 hypothetical protein [Vibrio fluvialis]